MKKQTLLLTLACTFSCSLYAQTIFGTKDNVDAELWTNALKRMTVKAGGGHVITHYNFGVQDTVFTYGSAITASAIQVKPGQNSGLVITDNLAYGLQGASLSIVNSALVSGYGINVHNYMNNTAWTGIANAACVYAENGSVGYFRRQEGNSFYPRLEAYQAFSSVPLNVDNTAYTGFRSYGALNGGIGTQIKDFIADDFSNASTKGTGATRYGLYLPFSKGNMTAAWGVYQSDNSVSNHFNGTTLFGTTATNAIDKAQVTGGIKTDGLSTGLRILPLGTTNYNAVNADYTIISGVGQVTVTLPITNIDTGKIFNIKKADIAGTTVIVSGTIDGNSAGYTLSTQYEGVTIQYNGTDYFIIGKY